MSAPFDKQKRPKVGVGVFITSKDHPGCVLIGKRKGTAPGEGQYALPGGHLEFGESWVDCAVREIKEETGLTLHNVQYCTAVNAVEVDKDYHYITVFMRGEPDSKREPENLEPDKCDGWSWCEWEKLPPLESLFCPLRVFRKQGESWEGCAIRETLEETGLRLTNVCFATVANGVDLANDYHYLELYMTGEVDFSYKSELENPEPEKCEGWFWMSWEALPPLKELFFPLRLIKEQGYKPNLPQYHI